MHVLHVYKRICNINYSLCNYIIVNANIVFFPIHLHTCIYLHIHVYTYIYMYIHTYTIIYWQGPGEGGAGGHALTPTANSVQVRTSLGLPSLI